jgi:hypothetical protein
VQMKTRVAGVLAATASAVALIGVPAFASDGPIAITSGDASILGGNQVFVPIAAPINVSGNAISLLGTASAFSEGGAAVVYGSPYGSW